MKDKAIEHLLSGHASAVVGPRARPDSIRGASYDVVWRTLVYTASLAACLGWTFAVGKDFNWDAQNYHLYLGFSAVTDRFGQDFYAASLMSYFNPYVYVPFYLMSVAGWPSALMGALYAVVHAVNLWLVYEIGIRINDDLQAALARRLSALGVVFAFLSPVFLFELGSSFSDITISVLVLGGWMLVARSDERALLRWLVIAGLLSGAATALKLSNAIFAVAAIAAIVVRGTPGSARVRHALTFCAACGIAFVVVDGPWAFKLWRTFGNPLFPFFNNIFQSPDLTTEPLRQFRFLPRSWLDALVLPFAIALPDKYVYVEMRAADIRYAALFVAAAMLGSIAMWRRMTSAAGAAFVTSPGNAAEGRTSGLAAMTTGFLVAWILWMTTSANGRYFLPMACLAGALLPAFVYRLAKRRDLVVNVVLGVLVAIQIAQVTVGSRSRFSPMEWAGPWFRVNVPERLQKEPFFYLSLDSLNGSFLAPYLAPSSGLMNISGVYVVAPDGPGGRRAQALINDNRTRLRTLTLGRHMDASGRLDPEHAFVYDSRLVRFGLRVDPTDCESISFYSSKGLLAGANFASGADDDQRTLSFMTSCAIAESHADIAQYVLQRNQADIIFDRVEDTCPKLFSPRRTMTERSAVAWSRAYMNTDIEMWISDGWVKFLDPVRGGVALLVGRAEDWAKGPRPLDCSKRFALAGNVLLELPSADASRGETKGSPGTHP